MKTIAVVSENVHLYVIHPPSQLDIIEELILFLEYNVVGSNDKDEEVNCREEPNMDVNSVEETNVEVNYVLN